MDFDPFPTFGSDRLRCSFEFLGKELTEENSIEDEYMFVGSNNHGARMILDSRGGTIVTFAQNPSKTRIRAAAYKPGFGCFGQQ
jgi:hypothetical protein